MLSNVTEEATALEPSKTVVFGNSLALAMLFHHSAEEHRRRGNYAAALVAYEQILSSYSYNEWPDRASLGVARCLVAFGDKKGARERLNDILKSTEPKAELFKTEVRTLLAEITSP